GSSSNPKMQPTGAAVPGHAGRRSGVLEVVPCVAPPGAASVRSITMATPERMAADSVSSPSRYPSPRPVVLEQEADPGSGLSGRQLGAVPLGEGYLYWSIDYVVLPVQHGHIFLQKWS